MLHSTTVPTAPLPVPLPEDPAVRVAFSRQWEGPAGAGNVSLVVGAEDGRPRSALAARERLAASVGLAAGDVVYAEQVHGAAVVRVGEADRGRGAGDAATAVPAVDALVTADRGVGLAVLAADCVPLLLAVPGGAVAAVHAGRKGFAAGIVAAALAELTAAAGAAAPDVVAVAGPSIGGCCYEVPEALAAEIAGQHPAAAATTSWGTPALDLRAGVVAELAAAGVGRVAEVGACTRCGGEGWFSARGSARPLGDPAPLGRHAGIIRRGSRDGSREGRERSAAS